MSNQVIECVPNFSDGQNKQVIDAIADAIKATSGVLLLDVDPGASTNRTVYTFVGNAEAVVNAALNAAKTAFKLIDMTRHKGEHPRLGAMDVCPFIPVRNATVADCIQCATILAQRLATELSIPVFLYGSAAKADYRKTVPQIRAGEYEALAQRLTEKEWQPDFGPASFVPSWGASMCGVRKFLVAYNVNVLGTKEQAHRIALNIRENGRGDGQPGKLRNCQAIGWYLEEHNIAQVSINLTDFDVTPMHAAFEEVVVEANGLNLAVLGSEVCGVVPLGALLQAAEFYIQRDNLFVLDEDQKVNLAINRLGLSSISYFNPKERIIEYLLQARESDKAKQLTELTLSNFVASVAARKPTPGGGSVAAAVAAMGAALSVMVGQMTFGKKQWEHLDTTMRRLIPQFHSAMVQLVPGVISDANAFDAFVDASRLPSATRADVETKEHALNAATMNTIEVPLTLIRNATSLWKPMAELALVANIQTKSDLQTAARCLHAGIYGAYYNVEINLASLSDTHLKIQIEKEASAAIAAADSGCHDVLSALDNRK